MKNATRLILTLLLVTLGILGFLLVHNATQDGRNPETDTRYWDYMQGMGMLACRARPAQHPQLVISQTYTILPQSLWWEWCQQQFKLEPMQPDATDLAIRNEAGHGSAASYWRSRSAWSFSKDSDGYGINSENTVLCFFHDEAGGKLLFYPRLNTGQLPVYRAPDAPDDIISTMRWRQAAGKPLAQIRLWIDEWLPYFYPSYLILLILIASWLWRLRFPAFRWLWLSFPLGLLAYIVLCLIYASWLSARSHSDAQGALIYPLILFTNAVSVIFILLYSLHNPKRTK